MKRRSTLMLLAAGAVLPAGKAATANPIQLHVDLEVDPAREQEMLKNFRETFSPAIKKQPGFVDVRLLKLRTALAGKAPANSKYRLLISFQTEEQRQKWVASDLHQKVWPTIENTLKGSKYTALLYDIV